MTEKKVGPGCDNLRSDVETVQQLLRAAGEAGVGTADGRWGTHTAAALQSFRLKYGSARQRDVGSLEPNDELLLTMAERAQLMIPLSGLRGIAGVRDTHRWFEQSKVKYNQGAQYGAGNRALWGVRGDPCSVVQTISGQFAPGRVEMDCTIYVNLMVSIYLKGDAHNDLYVADCSAFGDVSSTHLARERYGFPLLERKVDERSLNCFTNAADIQAATRGASLYVLEVGGGAQGGVSHMALLHDGLVYECTTGQAGSACISRRLDDFMRLKTGRPIYVFGPK